VNSSDPLFAICEACNATFTSFAFRSEAAEREVEHQFDAHACNRGERVIARPSPGASTTAGPTHSILVCRVCNKPIRFEEGGISTDENGKALHTQCYVNEIMENRKKNEAANSKE
jgi:Fe2+ or Zn2+ uptake regulation protein